MPFADLFKSSFIFSIQECNGHIFPRVYSAWSVPKFTVFIESSNVLRKIVL